MKVIVFGATGKTGQHVLHAALAAGHEVTAFGRSVDRIDIDDPALETHKGDVFDTDSVTGAVAGHDAAIVCLGSTGLRDAGFGTVWSRPRITTPTRGTTPNWAPRKFTERFASKMPIPDSQMPTRPQESRYQLATPQ